ncbi:hypothetical protein BH11MYX1_BH11MYX1_33160 [soil metagenome]
MVALDVNDLRRLLTDPWAAEDRGLSPGVDEALRALAQVAYEDGSAEARHSAEHLLYSINTANCFAPPLQANAALAWVTLMRAKLAALRRVFGGCAPINNAELRSRLHGAIATWGAYQHPLIAQLRDLDLHAYRIWAKNWFGSCVGFSAQLAALVQRTSGSAKKIVLENLADEFDDKVTHDVLRTRFYESLGLRFDAMAAPDDRNRVPEATELLNARTGLSYLRDPIWAFGCFYGVEANWPPECRLHLAINRARGADEHALEYWTSHAEADDHHAAEWLVALEDMCKTDEDRAAAIDGAMIQLRLRWQMYDAIAQRIATAPKG